MNKAESANAKKTIPPMIVTENKEKENVIIFYKLSIAQHNTIFKIKF